MPLLPLGKQSQGEAVLVNVWQKGPSMSHLAHEIAIIRPDGISFITEQIRGKDL